MVKIISELEKIGFEITDEQKESIKKSIGEELYSKQELDKKISKVETERDNYKNVNQVPLRHLTIRKEHHSY